MRVPHLSPQRSGERFEFGNTGCLVKGHSRRRRALQASISLSAPCTPPSSKAAVMRRPPISHLHLSVNFL
ncbi:Teneurin-4, partial [Manis pentadactyla]